MRQLFSSLSRPAGGWRNLLRRVHLCVGGILCIPLAVLGLTGSILVFEDELRAVFDPAPRAVAAGPAHALDDIIATARKAAPPGFAPALVIPADAAGASVALRLADRRHPGPGGPEMFIDPASLTVLAVRNPDADLLRRIFLLHANLLTHDRSGRTIVGWFGVAMLLLGASGPVLWWPRRGQWRAAFTVRRGARGHRLLRDLHGAIGIWGVAVLLVVSASGVYLAFPQAVAALVGTVLPARDLRPGAAPAVAPPQPGAAPLDADAAVALATAAVPDASLRSLALPLRSDQPYRVSLGRDGASGGAPLITVFVDPWAHRILEIRDPRDYSAGERVLAWMRPLHVGAGIGWPWRVVVFLVGFLPPLLAGTGVSMWLMKRRARNRRHFAETTRAAPGD